VKPLVSRQESTAASITAVGEGIAFSVKEIHELVQDLSISKKFQVVACRHCKPEHRLTD
jgi:hypothetical protein